MSETYWLVCKEYKCKRCAEAGRVKFFTMYDPVVLKLYHSSLVDDLDVVFTYKCAVSQSVADYIDDHAVAATSFYSMHKHIESNHRRAFDRARLKYAGHVDAWNQKMATPGVVFSLTLVLCSACVPHCPPVPPMFPLCTPLPLVYPTAPPPSMQQEVNGPHTPS